MDESWEDLGLFLSRQDRYEGSLLKQANQAALKGKSLMAIPAETLQTRQNIKKTTAVDDGSSDQRIYIEVRCSTLTCTNSSRFNIGLREFSSCTFGTQVLPYGTREMLHLVRLLLRLHVRSSHNTTTCTGSHTDTSERGIQCTASGLLAQFDRKRCTHIRRCTSATLTSLH